MSLPSVLAIFLSLKLYLFESPERNATDHDELRHETLRPAPLPQQHQHGGDRRADDQESYYNATRVFRGSTPSGGPFTKDLAYTKGFILIYNFLRLSIQQGNLSNIPLLFSGKINLKQIHLLSQLADENIIIPPKHVPPQFSDPAGLSAWMTYSLFLNQLDLEKLAKDYKNILA